MRYFLVSLLIIFPGLAAGQEIHTFSNGDVADADMINQNFDLLKDMSGGTAISVEANCAEDSLQFSRLWIEKSSYKNVVFHISGECEITEEVSRLFSALEGRFVTVKGEYGQDRSCPSSLKWPPIADEYRTHLIIVSHGKLTLQCLTIKGFSDFAEPGRYSVMYAERFGEVQLTQVSGENLGSFQARNLGAISAEISARKLGYVSANNNSRLQVYCLNDTEMDWRSIQVFSGSIVRITSCVASGLDSLYSEEGGHANINADLIVNYVNVSSFSQMKLGGGKVAVINQLAVRDNSYMSFSGTSVSSPLTIVQRGAQLSLESSSTLESDELTVTKGSGVFYSAGSGASLTVGNVSNDTTSYVSGSYP